MIQSAFISNSRVGRQIFAATTTCLAAVLTLAAEPKPGSPEMPLVYDGPGLPDSKAPDGRLMYGPGVQNVQVYRANRKPCALFRTDQGDQPGWTYQHHMDLACWQGRLYAAWAMTPKDEDVLPYRVVFASSSDGFTWSEPMDLFPPGEARANRFYFFRGSNDRMLAFTHGDYLVENWSGTEKATLLVRELKVDGRLGEVYTLVRPVPSAPPAFERSPDVGFVAACREAFNCRLLLEQRDYGVYLGDRRMSWHEDKYWPGGKVGGRDARWKFGKALCFFHRADGTLVGLSKLGFVTQSSDEGETWSMPVVAKGLPAGGAKVWAQRTPDGRYAMVYPPQIERFPMAVTTSDNGIIFRDMRLVHGEVPEQRYQGLHKDMGPQYLRGIAEWSGAAPAFDKSAIWVVYSVNKEDIWVSRIPVPILAETQQPVADTFDKARLGPRVPGWHIYAPTWAPVVIAKERIGANQYLKLEDREPSDYSRAIRTFPPSTAGEVSFRLAAAQNDRGRLEVELLGELGTRPVRLVFNGQGRIEAADGQRMLDLGNYRPEKWSKFTLQFKDGKFTVLRDRKVLLQAATVAEPSSMLYALSFRTGEFRGQEPKMAKQDLRNTEEPAPPCVYRVDDVITARLQLCR